MGKIKLFSHTDLDGVGCAILAYLAFGRENVDVEYCNYDDVDEKVETLLSNSDLRNLYDKIFITDISISEELAKAIDVWINPFNIRLFDHHATALWLNEYEWCTVMVGHHYSRIKTSGTELFSMYLFENEQFDHYDAHTIENIDRFIDIIRDYDTWRWKELGEEGIVCKQVNDLFHIYGREKFIDWAINQIQWIDNISPLHMFPFFSVTDEALLEQKQREIDIYVGSKDKQLVEKIDQFGHTYGVIFADRFVSELGNRLSELHPELDYVAMIDISHGTVSYRTTSEDVDLGGEIAHSHGGGGHRKAAGSQFDISVIRDLVIREVLE